MIKISQRAEDMPYSPIRKLMPYARKAKTQGKHIYHLNIGQPDIHTPKEALEAIRNLDEKIVSYGPSEGYYSLREKVAGYYQKFAKGILPEDIYVTTGASEAIMLALFCTCDYGEEIIIPEPFYANYIGFSFSNGIKIKPIQSSLESGFALPHVDDFEKLISDKTKAIFLCNPGNPTGQMYSEEELNTIVKLVKKHNIYLIVDEVYREFCYDQKFKSVLDFDNVDENVVVIDSISKVFSSCGARVGYIVTRNHKLQVAILKYAQLRLCPPYHGQKLAEACYDHGNEYIVAARNEYQKRRNKLSQLLSQIDDIQWYKPQAAFYNMVGLPIDDANDFCQWLLESYSHNGATVMFAPGDGFYHSLSGQNQIRMAYILNTESLENSMEILQLGLKAYQKIHKPSICK